MRQIVGVARNANYTNWAESAQECVYVPAKQKYSDAMVLYVRTKDAPQQIFSSVQREVRAAGPGVMVVDSRTGGTIVENGLFQARVGVALLTVFGMLALGLASIGLYGIMAYSVNQRKREIGLRMALGAAQTSVLSLILKQGMRLVLVGMLIGLTSALLVGQVLKKMLYGLAGSDPVSLASAAAVLLAVAILACYLPARGASRVDPLVALREG
jgi:ABC-type antimicrobial peptide transport system permease subunit